MCDFPLIDMSVIFGKWWIEAKKVTLNKETQVLWLHNHDVWYCLWLKLAKKVSLVITGSIQDSLDKKTEKNANVVKGKHKKESNAPQDQTLFKLQLSNEDLDAGRELEKLALEAGFSNAKHYEIGGGLMGNLVATR